MAILKVMFYEVFKYTKEEVLLSKDAKIVHIRLNERFNKIDLTKRWGKSTK